MTDEIPDDDANEPTPDWVKSVYQQMMVYAESTDGPQLDPPFDVQAGLERLKKSMEENPPPKL